MLFCIGVVWHRGVFVCAHNRLSVHFVSGFEAASRSTRLPMGSHPRSPTLFIHIYSGPSMSISILREIRLKGIRMERSVDSIYNGKNRMMKKYGKQMIRRDIKLLNSMVFLSGLQGSLWIRVHTQYTDTHAHTQVKPARSHRQARTHTHTPKSHYLLYFNFNHPQFCAYLQSVAFMFRLILRPRWAIVREYFSNLFFLLFGGSVWWTCDVPPPCIHVRIHRTIGSTLFGRYICLSRCLPK